MHWAGHSPGGGFNRSGIVQRTRRGHRPLTLRIALYELKYWYALLNQLADTGVGPCVRVVGQLANHTMMISE